MSFENLEFDKITDIISGYLKTYPALKKLGNLSPIRDIDVISKELAFTKEALEFITYDSSLYFEKIGNVERILKNTLIQGYILSSEELLEIKKTLNIYTQNRSSILNYREKYPLLTSLVEEISITDTFLKEIDAIIDDDGNILDSASPELKKIRKRKSSLRDNIYRELNKIMDSEALHKGLQERIVTVRDGRYVIPVRTAYKTRVNSIIHSFYKSGETAFVEPSSIVGLNNESLEIDEKELEEIRRILEAVTRKVADLYDIISKIYELTGYIEMIYAKARFAKQYNCGFPEIVHSPSLELFNARHPIIDRNNAVPIDLEIGKSYCGLIISGPNAGGKTVALKTAGLLSVMALCGLPVTADSKSKIGMFSDIMSEIGDEQSLSENLSTFSGHIKNISRIIEKADKNSLVLIDELSSATEPREGEALGRAIIGFLIHKEVKFIVTTHFRGIKEIPYSDTRVQNAFVEFDEKKLVPLYSLHTGCAGGSYAIKIARRYGLNDGIIANAEKIIDEEASQADKLLVRLQKEQNELFKEKEKLKDTFKEANRIKNEALSLKDEVEKEKKRIYEKGLSALRSELDDALKQVSALKIELEKARKSKPDKSQITDAEKKIDSAKDALKQADIEIKEKERGRPSNLLKGQTVYIAPFEKEGYIEDISGNKVKVRIGIISSIVDKNDLFLSQKTEKLMDKTRVSVNTSKSFEFILDFRGERVDDAIRVLESNLDKALIGGQDELIIIHGKGEGILRKAIWDYLKTVDFVKSFDYAKPEEGGQGKTVVILK